MFDVLTFLSDFGLDDIFVGVCHGVLADRAPHARVIDLTHAIEPGDVRLGSTLLARAVGHMPVAVHLAVVDPGVGGERRGIAVATGRGDVLVGPDNGLMVPAAAELDGVRGAWELAATAYRLDPPSATFHGRDIFAPAAAAVAAGVPPERLGPVVEDLVLLEEAVVEAGPDAIVAEVVLVDRFGNIQLAARGDALGTVGLRVGDVADIVVRGERMHARCVETFAELDPGALGLYEDSDRRIALAVRGGSARDRLRVGRGETVTVTRTEGK
jgi:S-adenosyl-L-methionine hydrolase (adenosine-forming)